MKKKNSKERLFEMFEKVTPNFSKKVLNERENGFQRQIIYSLYDRDGQYVGDLPPIDEYEYGNLSTRSEVISTSQFQEFAQEENITGDQIGKIKREYEYSIDGKPLSQEYYAPSQSTELYDEHTDIWYNLFGQQIRDPREYDRGGEGYTPFGDEGDDY